MSDGADASLNQLYDSLWESAEASFARGEVKVDEHLRNLAADRRRGLTVRIRFDAAMDQAIGAFIDELQQVEPGHYFYQPWQCHVTVLSLLTAVSDYVSEREKITAYERVLGEALAGVGPFAIRFEGVTATPEAVMVRGFPKADALNRMRAKIFEAMTAQGMPVRQRYPPTAAHVTVMRFSQPTQSLPVLVEILRSAGSRVFGTARVNQIEMVENDWYMSPDKVRVVKTYTLEADPP